MKCPDGICEPFLLVSINPIRNEKYTISTMINTEHLLASVKYTSHYQSYAYVVMMICLQFVMLFGNVIMLIAAFICWRKQSRNEYGRSVCCRNKRKSGTDHEALETGCTGQSRNDP